MRKDYSQQLQLDSSALNDDTFIMIRNASSNFTSPSGKQLIADKLKERLNEASECLKKSDFDGARKQYRKLLFLDANNVEFHRKYADILYNLGEFPKALVHYRRA